MRSLFARAAAVTLGLLLATATAAVAHPGFEPAEAPRNTETALELRMAHGCGDDETSPTTDVRVRTPDEVVTVTPREADGWELTVERDDDGRVTEFGWSDEDSDEQAPSFELDAVVDGASGDEVAWSVFQACEQGSYRWVGTDEDPAEDPAVVLTLADGPDEPPAEATEEVTETAEEATDEATGTQTETTEPSPTAEPDPSPSATPTALPGDEDTSSPLPLVLGGLVLLGVLAAVVYALSRQRQTPEEA